MIIRCPAPTIPSLKLPISDGRRGAPARRSPSRVLHRTGRICCCLFSLFLLAESLPAVVTLKVGSSGGGRSLPPFPTDGRSVRTRAGLWFVAYDGKVSGGRTIFLAVSKSSDPEFFLPFAATFTHQFRWREGPPRIASPERKAAPAQSASSSTETTCCT